ncbi:MAG: hypothetical protein IPO01_14920 [Chitinophagaceae bacterium]|nr:hypothetical protein [Chitinophagaceae bacterium]
MKIYITTILFSICSAAFGQSTGILKIIDSLQKKNIDTLIHYYQKCETYWGESNEYLLWRQKSSTKIMTYTSNELVENKYRYTIRVINDDTIFSYFNKHIDKIQNEHLVPMVCKIQMGDTTIYSTMENLHPCTIYLIVDYNGMPVLYENRKEDLDETFFGNPNLNYPFNSSTHLFRLIKMIQKEAK